MGRGRQDGSMQPVDPIVCLASWQSWKRLGARAPGRWREVSGGLNNARCHPEHDNHQDSGRRQDSLYFITRLRAVHIITVFSLFHLTPLPVARFHISPQHPTHHHRVLADATAVIPPISNPPGPPDPSTTRILAVVTYKHTPCHQSSGLQHAGGRCAIGFSPLPSSTLHTASSVACRFSALIFRPTLANMRSEP